MSKRLVVFFKDSMRQQILVGFDQILANHGIAEIRDDSLSGLDSYLLPIWRGQRPNDPVVDFVP